MRQGALPFKRPIRVEGLGVNIQSCSLSKFKMDKSQNVIESVEKLKYNKKKCIDQADGWKKATSNNFIRAARVFDR